MLTRRSVRTVCGIVMLGVVMTTSAQGWLNESRTTYLTFSGPVGLPGVSLGAGTYIFERVSATTPDVIRVLSRDRSKLYYMAFTRSTERPAGLGADRHIVLDEVPRGTPVRIKAWFPVGERTGHAFIYPSPGQ
jgi:hypothetical protein